MGRPKLENGKAKDAVVGLRYTQSEKKHLEKQAKRLGYGSLTNYLKDQIKAS
jgi:hypothetical protein